MADDKKLSPEHAPAPPALHDDPHSDPGDGQPSAVAGKGGKAEAEASAKPAAKKA